MQVSQQDRLPLLVPIAWGVTLAVSSLPDILFRELGGGLPDWLYGAKIGAVAILLAACAVWQPLRRLWLYLAALLGLYILQWGIYAGFARAGIQGWFPTAAPFVGEMIAVQIPRLSTALAMALLLLALTRSPKRFFFSLGEREAVAAPIPWIMTRPTPWKKLGPKICACLLGGMVVITWLMGSHPSPGQLAGAAPLLPLILLFAACNSFGEELSYRGALLAGLEGPLGGTQALAISAVYFGLAHFYGVPYGVAGVLLSAWMGWLLGKSMLETRGLFWPWLIHVCLDTVIFAFMAIGSIAPGG